MSTSPEAVQINGMSLLDRDRPLGSHCRSGVKASVLHAIGDTPLVELSKLFAGTRLDVYAKLEGLNPGGSMKDRAAFNILTKAIAAGEITAQSTIIESSSGNFAIGLAQACAYLGLPLICVVDLKTTQQNLRIMAAYGARVELVSIADPVTGEYLQARLNRLKELLARVPNAYWPNQYANMNNPGAHVLSTMPEIIDVLGEVDYIFVSTSTCGTLRGCAEYIRQHGLGTRIIAVDALGSVIFGRPQGPRLLPGHGAGVVPALFNSDLAQFAVHVSDLDCIRGCRALIASEAIMAGASSGGVIAAILRLAKEGHILPGSRCVAILADRGERYLDTVYSDSWVSAQFGSSFTF